MSKKKAPALELYLILKSVTETFSALDTAFKKLKQRRLIRPDVWKTVRPSLRSLAGVLDHAWMDLHQHASHQAFPELIREDQVIEQFRISRQTLYRRRKNKELPYIKDPEGVIWYPVFDLLDYVLKAKAYTMEEKPGRPRKF